MANLSNAIIEARKRHEAEIAERLKRRQERQRAEVERLNQSATGTAEAAPPAAEKPPRSAAPHAPPDALTPPETPIMGVRQNQPAQIPEEPADRPPVPAERTEPEPASVEIVPVEPVYAAPAPPPPAARPVQPQVAAPAADELETPPDGRFLKLRNDIIDRVKPYLTGNQFAVYLEIYRQTIGRGRTSAWFRTREIQTACNLGSDNTVRDAYPVLEAKRLIRLDPNRRVGSPRGLHITVLSVERALERLERAQGSAAPAFPTDVPAAPVAGAPQPVETPAPPALAAADPTEAADESFNALDALKRKYGVSPTMAPAMLDLVSVADRPLLPYLFRHLDRSIASGKVHNPAGLLRVWLESFDAWRPELAAQREADEQARRAAAEAFSKDELMLEWFRETEELVADRYAALDEDARETMRLRGRRQMLARSPSVRAWNEPQWESQLETYVKSEIRRELGTFEEWLARRGSL